MCLSQCTSWSQFSSFLFWGRGPRGVVTKWSRRRLLLSACTKRLILWLLFQLAALTWLMNMNIQLMFSFTCSRSKNRASLFHPLNNILFACHPEACERSHIARWLAARLTLSHPACLNRHRRPFISAECWTRCVFCLQEMTTAIRVNPFHMSWKG